MQGGRDNQGWEAVKEAIDTLPEKLGREMASTRHATRDAAAERHGVPDVHREAFNQAYDREQGELLNDQAKKEQEQAKKERNNPIDKIAAGLSHLPFVNEFRQGREQGKALNEAFKGEKVEPEPDSGAIKKRVEREAIEQVETKEERDRNKLRRPIVDDEDGPILQSKPYLGQKRETALEDLPMAEVVPDDPPPRRIPKGATELDMDVRENTLDEDAPRLRHRRRDTKVEPYVPIEDEPGRHAPEPPDSSGRPGVGRGSAGRDTEVFAETNLPSSTGGSGGGAGNTAENKDLIEKLDKLKTAVEAMTEATKEAKKTAVGAGGQSSGQQTGGTRTTIGRLERPQQYGTPPGESSRQTAEIQRRA